MKSKKSTKNTFVPNSKYILVPMVSFIVMTISSFYDYDRSLYSFAFGATMGSALMLGWMGKNLKE